ncbi:MAG: DUF1501 domain-containing protein, partial [Gemmataceae bacterium]
MYKAPGLYDNESPTYLGSAHRPFTPRAAGLGNLSRPKAVPLPRLEDRRKLLGELDTLRREVEYRANMAGIDDHTRRA